LALFRCVGLGANIVAWWGLVMNAFAIRVGKGSVVSILSLACTVEANPSDSGDSTGASISGTGITTTADATAEDGDSGTSAASSAADSGSADSAADNDDGGVKYDVGAAGDVDTGGGPLLGSCRASEIYGASGGFPAFTDPAYAPFLDRTVALVTHQPQYPLTNVMTILDISGDPPTPNVNYNAPKYYHPSWTSDGLGKPFGITLDSYGNIYLAASTVWGANPTPNKIRRIDAESGAITDFATLPNSGPAFGNLNYDCVSQTIYVSNHEDGRIYQLDMGGNVVSTYHHATGDVTMGPAADPGEPDGAFAPLGDRVWAVQSHYGRLYYSVWVEHSATVNANRDNEIWSVGYVDDDTGVPDAATAKKEFDVPQNAGNPGLSIPVSDLGFAHDGWMLIAQRTMYGDMSTSAHQSTTYDYESQGGVWVSQGTNYVVGELLPYSAAGGVDHDFVENGYVWMTGDALDFYTPDVVYGLQGTPYGGGGVETSTIIDLDGEVTSQDKTVYGDVELPIPGDVSHVPPPG
jgi:hypothetical protein